MIADLEGFLVQNGLAQPGEPQVWTVLSGGVSSDIWRVDLPGPARFRVGNETREWKMGQAWVFDDTIEHEAWNDADQTRVIMILDVWNPYLTEAERDLVSVMMAAKNEFTARG